MATVRQEGDLKVVSFTWEERLDGYYNIAGAGGSTCSEEIGGEWFDWARKEYGRYVDFDVEQIPAEEMEAFENFLAEEDEE